MLFNSLSVVCSSAGRKPLDGEEWQWRPSKIPTPRRRMFYVPRRKARLVPPKQVPDALVLDHTECPSGHLNFFATCAPGLEPVVAAELKSSSIGATQVQTGSRGVYFQGTWPTAFRASLWARCAIRILNLIATGDLHSSEPVYEFIKQALDWKQFLVDPQTGEFLSFSVQSRVWDCARVNNSLYASTRAKDAICDALRNTCGGRRPDPPESLSSADLPLFLSLYRDKVMLYRDLSGVSLHMRGYRDIMHKASLNEGIAAGILTLAGWNKSLTGFGDRNRNSEQGSVLLDPMCGSGTFLIEAALMATNSAPGLFRQRWPFTRWHDFNEEDWENCREQAAAARVEASPELKLLGNDVHQGALMLCSRDAEKAGVSHLLQLSQGDCGAYKPSVKPPLVVVNPPWGHRLSTRFNKKEPSLFSTILGLKELLKQHCDEADVYVLSGNSAISAMLQMRADKQWPLTIGGLECTLLHYFVLPRP